MVTLEYRSRGMSGAGILAIAITAVTGCTGVDSISASDPTLGPPSTRRVDVVDDYHGTQVRDPYRWLEDQDDDEVLAWAERQNAYTEHHLAAAGTRDQLRERLTELWNYERYTTPTRHGDVWVFRKNDGLQNQAVVYVADSPADSAEARVLVDPNTFSADGTTALGGLSVSKQGRHAAYAISESGSDWRTWRVLDVATGSIHADVLRWTKFTGATWTHDEAGFFYQRYPAPSSDAVYEASNTNPQLCYHKLGTHQREDIVVYERPDHPQWGFGATVTDDGRYAIVRISAGTDRRNRIAYIDLRRDGFEVQPLIMEFDASYGFVGSVADTLFFQTDLDAPQERLVAVDLSSPSRDHWRTVIPESAHKLDAVRLLGGQLVALYLDQARHRLARFAIDGKDLGAIQLPGIGSLSGLSGRPQDSTCYFRYQSFVRPPSIYAFDLGTSKLSLLRAPELGFDPSDFETNVVALQGDDGARLLMFLVHRKGLRLDGHNPTYLYGYGGFNISLTPRFSVPNLVWLERGGVYAHAILRGGGEFGADWHEAGMLQRKQNVFDDFAACARYLIRNDYASTAKLAIGGRSNGGLLVGATLNQHPELFGAAIPEVGVLDMLRYHQFTIGWAWASEYGRADDPDMFDTLFAYSPLHNVRSDVRYPPTMVMTGDHDDRVLPGHSYKFAAELQRVQQGAPMLLRVQRQSGHGAGKPVGMLIGEAADRWAFLDWALRD